MEPNILVFVLIGFIAQMIDGALGMAYGVTSNTFLLSIGISPAIASASVHSAEVFTTAASGLSHCLFGNVDRKLFLKLVIPGVLGGAIGAYALVLGEKACFIKPLVATYLLIVGVAILRQALRRPREREVRRFLIPLGAIGGFLDAIGGGGWGPMVTSTIVAQGHNPRRTVGSVNAAEFFVTSAVTATFITHIPALISTYWRIIVGLLLGGVIAAPLAAFICKKLPTRTLMALVGVLIIILSVRTLYLSLV
ncbi:MAG: sulfite exporter TauE/SafE family protein [Anaerolineae bacterium]|nr:sulfite exporter TauE/SafE family protein [Anaerolineae bacterium]